MPELPALPANARYVYHANECYDWGTIGWALASGLVDTEPYTYYIFMNSSVRGPFLAPYSAKLLSWQRILTDRVTDHVKLVGPTISCEGSPPGGRVTEPWRANPHVQSYVLATDKVRAQEGKRWSWQAWGADVALQGAWERGAGREHEGDKRGGADETPPWQRQDVGRASVGAGWRPRLPLRRPPSVRAPAPRRRGMKQARRGAADDPTWPRGCQAL